MTRVKNIIWWNCVQAGLPSSHDDAQGLLFSFLVSLWFSTMVVDPPSNCLELSYKWGFHKNIFPTRYSCIVRKCWTHPTLQSYPFSTQLNRKIPKTGSQVFSFSNEHSRWVVREWCEMWGLEVQKSSYFLLSQSKPIREFLIEEFSCTCFQLVIALFLKTLNESFWLRNILTKCWQLVIALLVMLKRLLHYTTKITVPT